MSASARRNLGETETGSDLVFSAWGQLQFDCMDVLAHTLSGRPRPRGMESSRNVAEVNRRASQARQSLSLVGIAAIAGPRKISRMTDKGPCTANGIQMNISADGPKIGFIFHQLAFEAALEQMPRAPVPFREPVGIGRQQSLHAA